MADDDVAEGVKEAWKKATAFTLTDDDVEWAKLLLGVDLASRQREHIQTATVDNLRKFANSCGNDDQLHCDPEYGETTRWSSVITPTMMAGIINKPLLGGPTELQARRQ